MQSTLAVYRLLVTGQVLAGCHLHVHDDHHCCCRKGFKIGMCPWKLIMAVDQVVAVSVCRCHATDVV